MLLLGLRLRLVEGGEAVRVRMEGRRGDGVGGQGRRRCRSAAWWMLQVQHPRWTPFSLLEQKVAPASCCSGLRLLVPLDVQRLRVWVVLVAQELQVWRREAVLHAAGTKTPEPRRCVELARRGGQGHGAVHLPAVPWVLLGKLLDRALAREVEY